MAPPLYKLRRFDWERIVLRTQLKPVALKALALVLATYADAESGDQIHPGLHRLSNNLGQDERTIRRNLEQLERVGLIVKMAQGSKFGRRAGMASVYQLTIPAPLFDAVWDDPDGVHDYAQEILDGRRAAHSTWLERNPQKKPERKKPTNPQVVRVSGTPDIPDRTPDISHRSPDIPDGTPDTGVRPSIISTIHEASNQDTSACAPSLRSGSARPRATPDEAEDDLDTFSFVSLPKDVEAEMNRQTAALRAAYPDQEW